MKNLKQKVFFHLKSAYVTCRFLVKKLRTIAYHDFLRIGIWLRLPIAQNMYERWQNSCSIAEIRQGSVEARVSLLEKLLLFAKAICKENQELQAIVWEKVLNDELLQSVKFVEFSEWLRNLEIPILAERKEEVVQVLWQHALEINAEIQQN